MSTSQRDLERVSIVLYLRGFVLLGLAAVAVRWPDDTLFQAMLTAGVVVGVLGACELLVAGLSTAVRATKGLITTHAVLSIAFGLVSLAAQVTSLEITMRLIGGWLLVHSVIALALASRVTPSGFARPLLLAWSALNVAAAFIVMTHEGTTLLMLMYTGAAYAAAYGVVQIATARWIRNAVA